jgi:hypothetical protein
MQSSHVGISFFFLIPTASPETPVNPSPFPTSAAQGLLAYPSNHEYSTIACPLFLLVAFLSGAVREAVPQADVSVPSQLGWKVLESFCEEFDIGACTGSRRTRCHVSSSPCRLLHQVSS